MKFVCNNCGFTAEIPVRRPVCPMCGSSNVSSIDETSDSSDKSQNKKDKENQKSHLDVRSVSTRVTLTEMLSDKTESFDKLFPEEAKKHNAGRSADKHKLFVFVLLFLLFAGLISAVVFHAKISEIDKVDEKKQLEQIMPEVISSEKNVKDDEIVSNQKKDQLNSVNTKKYSGKAKVRKNENKPKAAAQETIKSESVVEPKKNLQDDVAQKKETFKSVSTEEKHENSQNSTDVSKVKAQNNEDFKFHLSKGHKLLNDGEYASALQEYEKAAAIMPENGPVYKFMGIAHAYLGNQQKTCENYKKYLHYSPDAPDRSKVEEFSKSCQ